MRSMPQSSLETVALDRLIGRPVIDRAGRSFGRIQEVRVKMRGSEWIVTHYLIGVAGLLERLGLGLKLIVGLRLSGYVVRAEQIDLSDPRHGRLTCARDELQAA